MGDKISARNLVAAAGVPVVARHPRRRSPTPQQRSPRAARSATRSMVKASAAAAAWAWASRPTRSHCQAEYERVRGFAERMFGIRRCCSSASSDGPATSRCRCSASPTAGWWPSASATARCSGATRSSSRRPRRRRVDAGAARALLPGRGAGRRGGRLSRRRHGRVPARPGVWRVRLPGDEHPAAGRAPDHRDGDRARHGGGSSCCVAAGEPVDFDPDDVSPVGHAIEMRVNAEDPKRFLPGPGKITGWAEPTGAGVRVDAGYARGNVGDPALRLTAGQARRARRRP